MHQDRAAFLSEIAENAMAIDGLPAHSKGEFLRTLFMASDVDYGTGRSIMFQIRTALMNHHLLDSVEFHEGFSKALSSLDMVSVLIESYSGEYHQELSSVLAKVCGAGCLKIDQEGWEMIKLATSDVDYRELVVKVIEQSSDKLRDVIKILAKVFSPVESNQFEVSECVRLILASHWILDLLPTKKKLARSALSEQLVSEFPFTQRVVDDFVSDYLGLEPLVSEPSKGESSADSDVESAGSLADFVVDEDEGSDQGSDSSSDSSNDSSSSSSDSSSDRKRRRKRGTERPAQSSKAKR